LDLISSFGDETVYRRVYTDAEAGQSVGVEPLCINLPRYADPSSHVQFLPIRVIRKETGEEVPGYYVLHMWRHITALDEEHTKFIEPRDEKYPQLSIAVVALRREALRGVDIFRLKERNVSIYVSRRVKRRLEEMGVTGFNWRRGSPMTCCR